MTPLGRRAKLGSMHTLLDGKKVAETVYSRLTAEVASLTVRPKIVFIRVGEDPGSKIYVGAKAKQSEKLGLLSETIVFPEDIDQRALCSRIEELNRDNKVHGILVQLPLPKSLDKASVLEMISPEKDVDGLHPDNAGRLMRGEPRFIPCTPAGILEMLKFYHVPVEGARAVVIGRSEIVGRPMAQLLLMHHATVTICHSKTRNLPGEASRADILVVAMGKYHFVGPDFVKEGAVVIDVGQHRVEGKVAGDVDFEKVAPKASLITPVPGGVGPMTIAMLMNNVVMAAKRRA